MVGDQSVTTKVRKAATPIPAYQLLAPRSHARSVENCDRGPTTSIDKTAHPTTPSKNIISNASNGKHMVTAALCRPIAMSQQPQSAKRVRSNTSNEVTPQTAPGLRGRQPLQANDSHNTSSIGLYAPTGYNGAYGAIPGGRQDVAYGSYTATNQANGYLQAPFTEAYDPHGQSNAYAAQFGQPTEHITNPGGLYTHDSAGNARNGMFTSQVALRQAVPVASDTYPPSSALGSGQGSTYSAVQVQAPATSPRHNLQQQFGESNYNSSYSLTHNPAYHSQPSSYPEPTADSQYSPSISRTTTNVNGQSSQSPPEDFEEEPGSDEDAQGETADEAEITEILPNPKSKLKIDEEPPKPPDTKCACKKGRGKKKACTSCACSKYGRKCGKHCACGAACGNPFQDLAVFFGPSSKFPKSCDANPCFATWLSNQPNIEELDIDLMVDMLLYDDTSWANIKEYTKAFKDWEDRWLKAKNGKAKKLKEDRERLEFELLRGALGNCNPDDFHGFWYSFCRGHWVPMDLWEHCRECKACAPSTEWHCEQHGRCTTNRTCTGCTGEAP